MDSSETSTWLEDVMGCREGYETQAVEQFSDRLLRLAASRLPTSLNSRMDPEDIVQSVFRSFFSRHEQGKFQFQQLPELWRILAAITYHKVQHAIRHHRQQQRDARRELSGESHVNELEATSPTASSILLMMETFDRILAQLPKTHQEVVRLRLEGFSIEEIAQQLELSTRTVDRGLALARKIAGELMEDS